MNTSRSSLLRSPDDLAQATGAPRTGRIRVFVSFDIEHDGELYELLLGQSGSPGFDFAVLGCSAGGTATDVVSETVRGRIREADQVIVICGEHTDSSSRVSAELRIAQEGRIPYFLLWGRRDIMCAKPIGAKPGEGMYSWTRQILEEQITVASRQIRPDVAAQIQRNATRKNSLNSSGSAA